MTRVTIDREMKDRLGGLGSAIEICDESGRVLGVFQPVEYSNPADGSPFTDEEILERSRVRSGRSLAEILSSLENA